MAAGYVVADKYRIQKDDPGYSLWKWRDEYVSERGANVGQMVAAGWRPMNRYPHNLRHALMLISEDYLTDGVKGDPTDKELRASLREVLKFISQLDAIADEHEDAPEKPYEPRRGTLEAF